MKTIMVVPSELEREAYAVAQFRNSVKRYLSSCGACYDKFTVTDRDTFLGHVSETAVSFYLKENYGDNFDIEHWYDKYDPDRIQNAVMNNIRNLKEVEFVKEYFYDKYDLKITDRRTGRSIYADVKTAETAKQPQTYWDFLYPVIQNQKGGKDCVILCYYYKQANSNSIVLIGYITEDEISRKQILRAGTPTKFGTINKIDNYETRLTDYKDLSEMIGHYFGS